MSPNAIIAEHSRRWYRQLLMTPFILLAISPIAFHPRGEKPSPTGLVFGIAGVAAGIGFSLWNWRCSACNAYLGKRFVGVSYCHSCGAKLV
jgi:hypothetical protein